MAKHNNAGFPLTYCLLSTATTIDQGKQTKALSGWMVCLHNKYSICPIFVHSDKDMVEIGCSKLVWPEAKINLCWWHLCHAIRTCLAKAKLSTTPYNFKQARNEYGFINVDFIPSGIRVNIKEAHLIYYHLLLLHQLLLLDLPPILNWLQHSLSHHHFA